MKTVLFALAGLSALASASAASFAGIHGNQAKSDKVHKSHTAAEHSALAAVLIYADWCSSCKILEPKIKEAKAAGAFEGVDYIVLDYTGRDAQAMFAAADAAGVGGAVRAHLAEDVFTGWLLLVDRDDARVIGKVTKSLTANEISGAVKSAKLGA